MQCVAERVDGPAAEAVLAKMQVRNVGHVAFVAKRRKEPSYSGAIMARFVCINLFQAMYLPVECLEKSFHQVF